MEATGSLDKFISAITFCFPISIKFTELLKRLQTARSSPFGLNDGPDGECPTATENKICPVLASNAKTLPCGPLSVT